jgi:flagellar basal-body rod protein FlgF
MVNKTFLPPASHARKTLKQFKSLDFSSWHGIRSEAYEPLPAWESCTRFDGVAEDTWESGEATETRGAPPMENTLLVGLSRQTVLERQLDVISNNIANVNTNGFKADHSLFEEYLTSGAHEDNFKGKDRSVSYVQDRGTFRDFSQGAVQQTGNPLDVAIQGRGMLVVQAAGGERYTRDGNLQINSTGQLVTAGGNPVLGTSGPIVLQPTDHDIVISADGTITVQEGTAHADSIRGKLRLVSFNDAQKLLKQGNNLYSAGAGGEGGAADTKSTIQQGFVEKSNVNSVSEMSHMIEVMRTYTNIANILQQESDLHKSAIDKLADVPA